MEAKQFTCDICGETKQSDPASCGYPEGMRGWTDIGSDVNWSDYHGRWAKQALDGSWYIIDFDNLVDSCGEREAEEMGAVYTCAVKRVDLSEVSPDAMLSALKCCGQENEPDLCDEAKVECLVSYGCAAPLWDGSSKVHASRLRANARRAAEGYMRDAIKLQTALNRPVNRIGSTAREYGLGDMQSAMDRYVDGPGLGTDPTMDLMHKLGTCR